MAVEWERLNFIKGVNEPRRKLFRLTVCWGGGGLKFSLSHFVIIFETKVFVSECPKKEAAEWERLNFIKGVNEPRRKLDCVFGGSEVQSLSVCHYFETKVFVSECLKKEGG